MVSVQCSKNFPTVPTKNITGTFSFIVETLSFKATMKTLSLEANARYAIYFLIHLVRYHNYTGAYFLLNGLMS